MSVDSPRSSVFTFQSAVHSDHVLRCLDEQRRRDTLCDVTVVVESRSFRAHRAVLASCSDYFGARFSTHGEPAAVITLPDEITVEGFEPLLQFAYTTKLLFTKENILEIRSSAAVLGFKNLDNSCFEFLIPKFFNNTKNVATVPRKICCRKKKCSIPKDLFASQSADSDVDTDKPTSHQATLDEDDEEQQEQKNATFKPQEQPQSQQQSKHDARDNATSQDASSPTDYSLLCKYRKFQKACRMESCGEAETSSMSPATAAEEMCPLTGVACTRMEEDDDNDTKDDDTKDSELPTSSKYIPAVTESCTHTSSTPLPPPPHSEPSEMQCYEDMSGLSCGGSAASPKVKMEDMAEEISGTSGEMPGAIDMRAEDAGTPTPTEIHSSGPSGGGGGDTLLMKKLRRPTKDSFACLDSDIVTSAEDDQLQEPHSEPTQVASERSRIEQEVAEHLAKGLWPSDASSGPSAHLHWLKQLEDCPFLRDLGAVGAHVPANGGEEESGGGSSSRAQGSPYISSQNSGEESDSLDTEGDSEFYGSERACELPFSVERIASLSRNDFQQMLKRHVFTREQLDFVHDVRRRSKNRIAARRCRKRKLDCIHNLECEIEKLRTEKDKLTTERDSLNHQRLLTWQSFSGLYEKVCSEAALRPEQLQVLAKYSPSSCPLFALLSPLKSLAARHHAAFDLQDLTSASTSSTSCLGLSSADCSDEPSTSFAMEGILGEAQAGPQVLAPLSSSGSSTSSGKGFKSSSSSTSSSSSSFFGLGAFASMRPEPVSKLISDK